MSGSQVTDLVTKDKAKTFMKEILNIDVITVKEPCKQNLDYLNQIIAAFINKIPFQNFNFLCQPPENHTLPTIQEAVFNVLSGAGGLCWTNNSAFFLILRALGFSVHLVIAGVATRGTNDHTIVVARDVVKDGDNYLVQVGFGGPTFKAIDLDFEEESDAVSLSFNTFKYVKRGEEYIRMHKMSRAIERFPHSEGDWNLVYFFKLERLTVQQAAEMMQKAYESQEFFFRNHLRATIFKNNIATALKTEGDQKAIILQENAEKHLRPIKDYDVKTQREDLLKELADIFPMVPRPNIALAIDNYVKVIDCS